MQLSFGAVDAPSSQIFGGYMPSSCFRVRASRVPQWEAFAVSVLQHHESRVYQQLDGG